MSYRATIVTSVLNGARTLPRCIESVTTQTYPCEHLIVDGGSTDGSQEIVRGLQRDGLRLLDAPGSTISEAFNIGIQSAEGDIVGILNSDDWYEAGAVGRSVAALEANPQAGFTYGDVILYRRNRVTLARPVARERLERVAGQFLPFAHVSSFVRREIYDRFGPYDTHYRVAMDFDFYARIISRGAKGVQVEGIIGHVEMGGVSDNRWRRFGEYWAISSKYLGRVPAFATISYYNIRSMAYESSVGIPIVRDMIKRLGLAKRFREL